MARFKFKQPFELRKSEMQGGQLIKSFSAGDVINGTKRLHNTGVGSGTWFVDVTINGEKWAIPYNVLTEASAFSFENVVIGGLILLGIGLGLKAAKVI